MSGTDDDVVAALALDLATHAGRDAATAERAFALAMMAKLPLTEREWAAVGNLLNLVAGGVIHVDLLRGAAAGEFPSGAGR